MIFLLRHFSLTIFIVLISWQSSHAQQHNFRSFNVEDGLSQSQVYSIYQEETGHLWLGTRGGGISVFDGIDFISISEKEGLTSNYINDIVKGPQGTVLIGTSYGLTVYDGLFYSAVKFPDAYTPAVRSVLVHEEIIYLATNVGVFQVEISEELRATRLIEEKLDVTSLAMTKENCLWIGTNKGLFSWKNGRLDRLSDQSKFMRNSITCLTLAEDGTLWIGTYGDGMYCHKGDRFFRIDYQLELYRETVLDIYVDSLGDLWIGTLNDGLVHYQVNTNVFSVIGETEGLSNNHVRSIWQDNNNDLWIGTSGGGVNHYLGKQFTMYDQNSGLGGNFIYSVARDTEGNMWVGNSRNGVSRMSSDGIQGFNGSNGFLDVKVKSMAPGKEGSVWLGTGGSGLFLFRNDEFEEISGVDRAYVKQIKVDKSGAAWLATAGSGLIKVSPKRSGNYLIEKWTMSEGLISNRLTALEFDSWGRVWYATEGDGIGCFTQKNASTQKFNTKNGLSSNVIRSLCLDGKGKLWVGTAGGGLSGIDIYEKKKKIVQISQNSGLTSDNIYLLASDELGNLIVGSEKGVDHVFFGQDGGVGRIKHYGKAEGFAGVETCQNAVWNDTDGSIWLGTINGLSHFNPKEIGENRQAPILSMNDVKLFYESILNDSSELIKRGRQNQPITFGYDDNRISFDFLGLNFRSPNRVMYRWRLVGFDSDYSPPSTDRSIMYSNIGPGVYTFQLIAANEEGVWSETPLEFHFTIETPIWRRTWFIVSAIAVGLLFLFLLYRITIRRIRRKAEAKQKQVEIEKDYLELEQKALRLQMNPHFIFNALNSIQSLIGTGKETEARYYLAKFSRLMRQILDNSRKSEITLEEEVNTLENYLLIEQFCSGNSFEYSVDCDASLEVDFINLPPMMIQPFVENCIKHGFKRKEGISNKIRISFKELDGTLVCVVEDNGIGREKSAEINQNSQETYHESTSMRVINERLELLNVKSTFKAIEIVDLTDEEKRSLGTRIIIRIPID